MTSTYNVYCDESCHLEHDGQPIMVLGAVWCPTEKSRSTAMDIREIKKRHNMPPKFETKWIKVSPAKLNFYQEMVDYFFDNSDLHFRALVVPDKSLLNHEQFGQDHDTWYYKMYFDMLKVILNPEDCYRIYLDIKDTRSAVKVNKLHDVLCNNMYDFQRQIIERVQTMHSHESEILQLTDLLVGIISYANRRLTGSPAKLAILKHMKARSGYELTKTTLSRENKVNLFMWHASEK